MPSLNSVHLIGHVTRDPDVRVTPKGTAVAEIGLAINRTWTDDQGQKKTETTFVDVTLWARVAEAIQKFVKKGDPLFVDGRLVLETWNDKQTGQKRSKLKVIGEGIQLLTKAPSGDRGEPTPSPALREQRRFQGSGQYAPEPDEEGQPDNVPY